MSEDARLNAYLLIAFLTATVRTLYARAQHEWPITFSVGVGIFPSVPEDVDQVIAFCERLMYRVKALGKNKVRHRTFDPNEVDSAPPARLHSVR